MQLKGVSSLVALLVLAMVSITAVAVYYTYGSRILSSNSFKGEAAISRLERNLEYPPRVLEAKQHGRLLYVDVYNPNLDYLPWQKLRLWLYLENGSIFKFWPQEIDPRNCRLGSKGILAGESCTIVYNISALNLTEPQMASISVVLEGTNLFSTSKTVALESMVKCIYNGIIYNTTQVVLTEDGRLLNCTGAFWEELPCNGDNLCKYYKTENSGTVECLYDASCIKTCS